MVFYHFQELDLKTNPKPFVFILHTFLSAKVHQQSLSWRKLDQKTWTRPSVTGPSDASSKAEALDQSNPPQPNTRSLSSQAGATQASTSQASASKGGKAPPSSSPGRPSAQIEPGAAAALQPEPRSQLKTSKGQADLKSVAAAKGTKINWCAS